MVGKKERLILREEIPRERLKEERPREERLRRREERLKLRDRESLRNNPEKWSTIYNKIIYCWIRLIQINIKIMLRS